MGNFQEDISDFSIKLIFLSLIVFELFEKDCSEALCGEESSTEREGLGKV